MTGYAGQKGTADLSAKYEEQLLRRLPSFLIDDAKALVREYEPPEVCMPVSRVRIMAGGVPAALWLLAEKLQTGLCADLRAVPIRQETVEICEVLDVDPYELRADGAWLIAVRDAQETLLLCRLAGIPAAKIGSTAAGADRTLACGEIIRYLERV